MAYRRVCNVDNCDRPHYGLGYCQLHYRRVKETGSTDIVTLKCHADRCEKTIGKKSQGYCQKHRHKIRKYGDPNFNFRREPKPRGYSQKRDIFGRKQCTSCEEWHHENSFNNSRKNKDGLTPECKTCRSRRHRKRAYGVDIDALLDSQNYKCEACKEVIDIHLSCVDHNHDCCPGEKSCGKCVRGVLCNYCNIALGGAKDDPVRLIELAIYIVGKGKNERVG